MRYKYIIKNLDCANCAREVEEGLAKDSRLQNVVVNFGTSKLSFETDQNIPIEEINRMVTKIEPEAKVVSTEDANSDEKPYAWLPLLLGIVICVGAHFAPVPDTLKYVLYVIAYGLLLHRVAINATKLLFRNHTINENALILISCLGALAIGEVLEGMMVIVLYTIGKILETRAINKSRRSISELLDLKQPFAEIKVGEKTEKVPVEKVKSGDVLVVKKGEKIPVDGCVIKGKSKLDMSALTGESELVMIEPKTKVLSGSINLGNPVEIRASTTYDHSMAARILDLLEEATDRKAKTETMIAKVSKIYTPIVMILAALVMVILPVIFHVPFSESIYRGLTFLVIACPCAIAISVPLSYFTGIGAASGLGILVKGSNYLDNLYNAKNIIFDKTGTLTDGGFAVTKIKISDAKYSEEEIIDLIVKGESLSNHPIASSILKLKPGRVKNQDVKNFHEVDGQGISFQVGKKKIKVGNRLACNCQENAILHVNIDGKHAASITINDGIKPGAEETIRQLKENGLTTYMFTGDKNSVATAIGKTLGIDKVQAEMLPDDKFRAFERIEKAHGMTVFVGDGINDAPVLKRSDVGIAMGAMGSESAIEAADIVIMNDDLLKIPQIFQISRYTRMIIYQNLIFALGVKVLILILSTFGLVDMWWAVFADTGATLIAILNTLRILRKFRAKEPDLGAAHCEKCA